MAQRPKATPKSKGRKSTVADTDKAQSERFKKTARELGVDESGKDFKRTLDSIVKPKRHTRP